MTGVVLYAAATVFVGGMALLAQWARGNRRAEITLVVTLLALSLLVAAVGSLTAVGLFTVLGAQTATLSEQVLVGLAGVAALMAAVAALALCIPPLRSITGGRLKNSRWADPPFFLALWFFALILAYNVVSLLIFTQIPDVAQVFQDQRLSAGAVFAGQIPFFVVAVLGVGAGVRRNLRQTVSRLGYGRISLAQLGIVALFVVVALGLSALADALFRNLQPELYRTVGNLSETLFSPEGLSPLSAVLFALLVGLGAGLGEETLFRGALQPTLGILPSSLLFASMHVQYGPSVLIGYILLLSVGLGLLRRYINTTASFLAHAAFNTFAVLLSYFFVT